MSWLVNRYIKDMSFIKERGDIESTVYNNALMIERAIKEMNERGLLTDFEKDVLWAISKGYSYSETARLLGSHRLTISDTFNTVTDRIAFILGGEFTDSGFLEKIQTMGALSEVDVDKLFKKGLIKAESND